MNVPDSQLEWDLKAKYCVIDIFQFNLSSFLIKFDYYINFLKLSVDIFFLGILILIIK